MKIRIVVFSTLLLTCLWNSSCQPKPVNSPSMTPIEDPVTNVIEQIK